MRLDRLEIDSWKNLCNFSIDFDESSYMTVLVGQNGTGKSNLLEALTIIFRDLSLGRRDSEFDFRLDYICRGHKVRVDADRNRPQEPVQVDVDGRRIPFNKFERLNKRSDGNPYLPKIVFGYYSGPSERMAEHFHKHAKEFDIEVRSFDPKSSDVSDVSLPNLFYAELMHSQFVLLSFFLQDDDEATDFLKEYLGVLEMKSVLFVLKEPSWSSRDGDPRFWNARGLVQGFLNRLYDLSLAPLRMEQRIKLGFRHRMSVEHLYLYLRGTNDLRELAVPYRDQSTFFKALESARLAEIIKEVRTSLKIRNVDGSITFRELSEGEQQLLMVLGLLRFTQEEESLFLLDEPDTHLNPAWSMEYLDILERIGGRREKSHVIMTTHSPLVFAGLEKSQVQIMQRDRNGTISAQHPDEDPRGMGVEAILTSELFGLRAALDKPTMTLLDERRELTTKRFESELSDQELERLDWLNEYLESLAFSIPMWDPRYELYLSATSRLEDPELKKKMALPPKQIKTQKKVADKIVKRIAKEIEDEV